MRHDDGNGRHGNAAKQRRRVKGDKTTRNDNGNGWHDDGKGQHGDGQHDNGKGQHGNGRQQGDSKGQQGNRWYNNGDG